MISVQGRGHGSQSTEARAQSVGFHFISFHHQTDFKPAATEYPWWVFFTRNLVLQTSSLSWPGPSTLIQTKYSSVPHRDDSDSWDSSDWMFG